MSEFAPPRKTQTFGGHSFGPLMNNHPRASPNCVEEELKRFQGTWKQIAYERDGVTEPADEQGWNPITTFTVEEFVVTLADGSIPIRGTYRIDPTRNPKTVDWTDTIGEDAGKTLLAIYSFQEDRFTFCAAYTGMERPTEFRTRPGQVLRVFERVPSAE
jgi:uncharacterized protein (TIGR03067 family)